MQEEKFDINKYKDYFWCETVGYLTWCFQKTDAIPVPNDFAESIHKEFGIEKIENEQYKYRVYYEEDDLGGRPFTIYAFKDKQTFLDVIEMFKKEYDFDYILERHNLSLEEVIEESKKDKITDENIIDCAKDFLIQPAFLDFEDYCQIAPLYFKKYMEIGLNILRKVENKTEQMNGLIIETEDFINEEWFLYYHDFINLEKNYYA